MEIFSSVFSFSLIVTINIQFNFTQFLKEIFLNVVLIAIYVGSGLKVIGEFIPSTRSKNFE